MTESDRLWTLPTDSYALIKHLEAQFPARCIQPDETLEEAHRYAGKRELVEELVAKMAEELGAGSDS